MMNIQILVFSSLLFIRAALAASLSISSWMTRTIVVTNYGATYTKTPVELYTGQPTTTPTSGTYTTTIYVSNSRETYTKTMLKTYGLVSESIATSHLTVKHPSETYTKTLSTTLAVSSGGSGSESDSESDSSTSATDAEASTSDSTSSSADGAAGLKAVGSLVGFEAMCAVAMLLL